MIDFRRLTSGATGESPATRERRAQERRSPDDGWGGMLRSEAAKDTWQAVMGERLVRERDEASS